MEELLSFYPTPHSAHPTQSSPPISSQNNDRIISLRNSQLVLTYNPKDPNVDKTKQASYLVVVAKRISHQQSLNTLSYHYSIPEASANQAPRFISLYYQPIVDSSPSLIRIMNQNFGRTIPPFSQEESLIANLITEEGHRYIVEIDNSTPSTIVISFTRLMHPFAIKYFDANQATMISQSGEVYYPDNQPLASEETLSALSLGEFSNFAVAESGNMKAYGSDFFGRPWEIIARNVTTAIAGYYSLIYQVGDNTLKIFLLSERVVSLVMPFSIKSLSDSDQALLIIDQDDKLYLLPWITIGSGIFSEEAGSLYYPDRKAKNNSIAGYLIPRLLELPFRVKSASSANGFRTYQDASSGGNKLYVVAENNKLWQVQLGAEEEVLAKEMRDAVAFSDKLTEEQASRVLWRNGVNQWYLTAKVAKKKQLRAFKSVKCQVLGMSDE